MKSQLITIDDHGVTYPALQFICPGCISEVSSDHGLHMLPINTQLKSPSWDFDGNLESPTISPSILTRTGADLQYVYHSFLTEGVFQFLEDSTHPLSGQFVPIPDLPDWVVNEE